MVRIEEGLKGIRYATVTGTYGLPQKLSARNIGSSYTWMPGTDLDNAQSQTPMLTPTANRNYLIRITTSSGCVTMDSLSVVLASNTEVSVPTAFAPNGNGANDVLRPLLVNIASIRYFRIYNRWGQLLYETRTQNEGWDGTFRGQPQPVETYTWIFEGLDGSGAPVKASGKTVLIR